MDKFRCDQMSANGKWMIGRSNTWYDGFGSYYTESSIYDVENDIIYGTDDLFTLNPYSRPISSTGVAVMSTYDEATSYMEVPFLIVPGQRPKILKEFYTSGPYAGKECCSVAIADDASCFLGYYDFYPKQVPFVCAIHEDYTIGEPQFLPLPTADIFGNEPYCVALTCISRDCKTVVGTESALVPGIGAISYPIVYRLGDDGKWSFTYPLAQYYENIDPENCLDFYADQVALSPDGTKMACTQEKPSNVSNYPIYVVWTIDLENGTAAPIESTNPDILATQILDDGTIVGTFFATIKVSYIYLPGATDFIDFLEYMKETNPEAGEWMDENLLVMVNDYDENGDLVVKYMPNTGQVYVSDDLTALGSGFQTNQYDEYYNLKLWSYLFSNLETLGVKDVDTQASFMNPGAIYNLQGVKISKDAGNLPSGVYIVDGKKVFIRN